ELTDQLREHIEAAGAGNNADRSYLAEDVRSSRDVRIMLNLCWMPMTAQKLIDDMFSKPEILAAVTPGFSDAERALLQRAPGAAWSESDVPLLDEAAELLGEM